MQIPRGQNLPGPVGIYQASAFSIRSRCRVLSFAELDQVDIRQVLVSHGRSPQTAEAAALASCGSLAKALALDEQALAAREELLLEFEDLGSGGSPVINANWKIAANDLFINMRVSH